MDTSVASPGFKAVRLRPMSISAYHGVARSVRNWQAAIRLKRKSYALGSFETEEAAARAYDNAAFWLWKAGRRAASLNFPGEYFIPLPPEPTQHTSRLLLKLAEYNKPCINGCPLGCACSR